MIALEKAAIKGLLIRFANKNMQKCYPIIIIININYKQQVVIISIKSGMQYSI